MRALCGPARLLRGSGRLVDARGAEGGSGVRAPRLRCGPAAPGGRAAAMAAAEPASSAQPTPQAQAQPPPPPPGAPSSQPPAALAAGSSRHEKSLGLLTTKFVSLLQEAQDGVLDLKAVSGGGDGGARPEGAGSTAHTPTGMPDAGVGAHGEARRRGAGRGAPAGG